MNEHVAYAMRNEEAVNSLIYFNNPFGLMDWSHMVIELVVISGFLLACLHAYKTMQKTGSISAPLTLLACLTYGLVMDILSYYTVESFWHGEFSVMFLYNKLPLYIACFYPAYMYHNYMLIHRFNFPPVVEAICLGFFDGMMYLIFDNLGPMVNWWTWDMADPTNQPFLSNVPLTSYHWFFTFTIAFSLVNRKLCWDWVEKGASFKKLAAGMAAQPVLTILVGSLLFIPYNLFAKNMPPYDALPWDRNLYLASAVDGITFMLAGWLFVTRWYRPNVRRDELLMVFPFLYLVTHAYIYIAKFDVYSSISNGISNVNGLPVGNLIAVILAFIGSTAVLLSTALTEKDRKVRSYEIR
ncbi:Uncharacterised protein [BD1-7 clade bacterium]|uniref:DUF7802 domain-containing protein n=1 Tax=BD1-7 clade bacterium TaxID=2029982 RepID=A0A5S9QUF1_9GAMM|nr:Uncharacterised protein [BD1-7 clade bacterium]